MTELCMRHGPDIVICGSLEREARQITWKLCLMQLCKLFYSPAPGVAAVCRNEVYSEGFNLNTKRLKVIPAYLLIKTFSVLVYQQRFLCDVSTPICTVIFLVMEADGLMNAALCGNPRTCPLTSKPHSRCIGHTFFSLLLLFGLCNSAKIQ